MGERALTVRDRILVHLSAFNRFAEEFECPEEMCQAGISAAIGKSRAHITLELKRMREAGLVTERNARVKGAKSKRKTYLLTSQGMEKNSEIGEFLNGLTVELTGPEGTKVMSGTESAEYLRVNCGMQRVVAVDTVLESGGKLDVTNVRETAGTAVPSKYCLPISAENFQPRKEMDEILNILKSEKPNTILLLGIPGIGKTALLAELARNGDLGMDLMYRRLYPFDSATSVLGSIAEFLSGLGETDLRRSMAHPGFFDLFEGRSHLAGCFCRRKILLAFDEYDVAGASLGPLFGMLMEIVKDTGSGMIVASSRKGGFYSLKNLALDNKVREITLGPLDPYGASMLLKSETGEESTKFLELAGGHPLTLKLLAAGMGTADLAGLVEDEMLGKDPELARICRFAAVLRRPFTTDDLELFGFENASCMRHHLAFEAQPGGGYLVHPAVSSIMLKGTGKRMLRELHSRGADFCLQSGSEPHEALHHLILARDIDRARELALEKGDGLLETDNIEELAAMMEILLLEGCESVKVKVLASLASDRAGKWERAMTLAADVEACAPETPEAARMQTLRANILAKRGKLEEALLVLDAIPKSPKGPGLKAGALYSRASTLRRMGRNKEALKACNRAARISGDEGNKELHTQCLMEGAMIMAGMGEHDKALKNLKAAMSDFEELGSIPDRIRCNINLGMVLRGCDRAEEGISALEKAVAMSEKAGLNRFRAHALVNLTDLLNRRGDYGRSCELAGEAVDVFSGLGEPLMQAAAMLNLCAALAGVGEKGRAMAVMDGAIALLDEKKLLKARRAWVAECAEILRGMGEEQRAGDIVKRYG